MRRTAHGDATSWSPIRLYQRSNPRHGDSPLPTGALSTPVATFSDGAHLFALYLRGEDATCRSTSECPERTVCSSSAEYRGERLGVCAKRSGDSDAPGALCRSVVDCPPGLACQPTTRGVCVSQTAFVAHGLSGDVAPAWYAADPRLGIARVVDVAFRLSPDHSDYAVVDRFVTNRFVNVSARTVAHFDPDHPEQNDYRPGNHTLLLFGRSSFLGSNGAQALPFLAYQVLTEDGRSDPRAFRLRLRFYAGSGKDGAPHWSASEEDAVPVYGTETALLSDGGRRVWTEPEFDYVNQMSVSFVPALGRWIMLYGGDVPAFMVRDPHTGHVAEPTYRQPVPGAIYLRTARHPWGAGPRDAGGAWSSPSPVLTREMAAPYLACGSDGRNDPPGCLSDAPRPLHDDPSASGGLACMGGDLAGAAQSHLSGNPIGRFYAPNVIDEWTESGSSGDLAPPGTAATIHWNVSTWNPYQVILVRSVLESR